MTGRRLLWTLVLALAPVLASRTATADERCPPHFVFHSEDADAIYCAPDAEVMALQARICELERKIDKDRREIEAFQKQLPGYFEALEEWRKRSDRAVRGALEESMSLLVGGLLALNADQYEKAAELTREQAKMLQRTFVDQVANNKALSRITGGQLKAALAEARGMRTMQDLYNFAGALKTSISYADLQASDAAAVEKVVKGALQALEIVAAMPAHADRMKNVGKGLGVINLADYAINYIYAATAYGLSWARINQLRDTRLHAAAAALQGVYQDHIEAHKELVERRVSMIGPDLDLGCEPAEGGEGSQ